MLGIQTRGGRMEGVNESTELWRHPNQPSLMIRALEAVTKYTWPFSLRNVTCSAIIHHMFTLQQVRENNLNRNQDTGKEGH